MHIKAATAVAPSGNKSAATAKTDEAIMSVISELKSAARTVITANVQIYLKTALFNKKTP